MGIFGRLRDQAKQDRLRRACGPLVESGEKLLGQVRGEQAVWAPQYARIPALMVVTDRACYFGTDACLFRLPYSDVERLHDSWGNVTEMCFILREEARPILALNVGDPIPAPYPSDEFPLARPAEYGTPWIVFIPGECNEPLRDHLQSHVQAVGGITRKTNTRDQSRVISF